MSLLPSFGASEFGEDQHALAGRYLNDVLGNQVCPFFRKLSAENARDAKERTTTANQTGVTWAVADDITISTQHSILQWDGIENPGTLHRTSNTRTVHHRTLRQLKLILLICYLMNLIMALMHQP